MEVSKTKEIGLWSLVAGNLPQLGLILAQLAGLIAVIYLFKLEASLKLLELSGIVAAGFVGQLLVPFRLRIPYFIAITLAAVVYLAGWYDGSLIIGYGMALVLAAAAIKKPLIRYLAVLLLFGALIALAAMQTDWVRDHFVVFSILGSMFMFRLSLFLYERHYQPNSGRGLLSDIAYFFMLPNMAIALFPVVDYQTFSRQVAPEDHMPVYKKGVQWMVLGVFHLLVYRLIYYYIYIPNQEVTDVWTFGHYAVTNYLLIIRLSGIYHFSVGVLCLFGFNLPSVFNNYFLASGFSDLWRRINIYYRDYVIKVFYYPLFFRFRKYGMIRAQVVSILLIFVITWLLHSFQWFWLKGKFPVRSVDMLYWGVFGILVAINAVTEMKKSRQVKAVSPWWNAYRQSGQILFMFLFMSVLWSLWSAKSLPEWLATLAPVGSGSPMDFIKMAALILGFWAVAGVLYHMFDSFSLGKIINPAPETRLATMWSFLMLGGLLVFQTGPASQLAEKTLGWDLSGFVKPKLKESDEHLLVEGYYEEILVGNELTNPVGELQEQRKNRFKESEAAELVNDIRNTIHKPGVSILFKDKPYSTNQWGMRDKKYEKQPSPGTIRVGFTGGSFVVGSGVADNEIFDHILEERMNKEVNEPKYEFLNFSNSGYDLIQCLYDFEQRKFYEFKLDYLVYVSHGVDLHKNIKSMLAAFNNGYELPYPYMEDILKRSGVQRNMPENQQLKLLEPFEREFIDRTYTYFGDMCRKHGFRPVWLYWPTVAYFIDQSEYLQKLAKEKDFIVINLEHLFDSYDPESISVSATDRHPNALGHKIVADALFEFFSQQESEGIKSEQQGMNK
jgi:hypothetical protein